MNHVSVCQVLQRAWPLIILAIVTCFIKFDLFQAKDYLKSKSSSYAVRAFAHRHTVDVV